MKITITKEQLMELGACPGGVTDLKEKYGDSVSLDFTYEAQLQIIQGPLRKWFGWCVRKKIIPMWSMSRADLSGANLSGVIGLSIIEEENAAKP